MPPYNSSTPILSLILLTLKEFIFPSKLLNCIKNPSTYVLKSPFNCFKNSSLFSIEKSSIFEFKCSKSKFIIEFTPKSLKVL